MVSPTMYLTLKGVLKPDIKRNAVRWKKFGEDDDEVKGNHLGSSAPPTLPQLPTKKLHLELNPDRGQVRLSHQSLFKFGSQVAPISSPPPRAIFGRDGHPRGFKWVLSRREGGRWRQVLTLVTSRARYTLEP